MRYRLAILTFDDWPVIEISSGDFEEIKKAKTNVSIALAMEEKFEILVENYSEYERTLLDLTLNKMVRQDYIWDTFSDDRQTINRRVANLLTAAKLYIDQTSHDFATIYGSASEAAQSLKKACSCEYDRLLGYRVMEEIRRYIQHRSLPVGTLTYPCARQRDGNSAVRFGLRPELDVDGLRNDPKFKRSVLAEIEQQSTARDLTFMIRQFVQGLTRVHHAVRELTAGDVDAWTTTLGNTIARAETEIKHTLGLAAIEEDDDGNCPQKIYVVQDMLKRLHDMRKRYRNLKFVSGWYISNAVQADPKS